MIIKNKSAILDMFTNIGPKYDFINHLLSFGLDFGWRKQVVKYIPDRINTLLDLCCGTGDQLFSIIKKKNVSIPTLIGMDMSLEMLDRSRYKAKKKNLVEKIKFLSGDAVNISLADNSIDIVTVSFGIRNVYDLEKSLSEIYRILKPSGKLIILEFSIPENRVIRKLFIMYISCLLPIIGGILSGNFSAYFYLARTIKSFPSGKDFILYLQKMNFKKTSLQRMNFGSVTIYSGTK
ncbi:MAG: bifunctional demethylmenaquinone methyltransferase/2-methoxy-6-polyprenyl-1,4-benzoquinol methylase UbiE [bacterium]|nr:bifunctional demethylmenaquinone methyltransferase/2-methoxy-6-polyprenyl-1,4-benzoquinol methylase UbiE [bacterium]